MKHTLNPPSPEITEEAITGQTIYLSPKYARMVRAKASEEGMSFNELVRMCIRSKFGDPDVWYEGFKRDKPRVAGRGVLSLGVADDD